MGKLEMWRREGDDSRRTRVNRKCARPEGTDVQERKKRQREGSEGDVGGGGVTAGEPSLQLFLRLLSTVKRFGTTGTDPQKQFRGKYQFSTDVLQG